MLLLFRLSWKELKNHYKFSLFFILSLSLGLTGLTLVATLRHAVEQNLEKTLREILSADLVVASRVSYSDENDRLIARLAPEGTEIGRMVSFFSMVSSTREAELMHVVGVDNTFPLYGVLRLQSQREGGNVAADLAAQATAWMSSDALRALGVREGDAVRIGEQRFLIRGYVSEEPPGTAGRSNIAPKVYVGLNWLENTKLIQLGSRINHYRLLKLPAGTALEPLVKRFVGHFSHAPADTPFRVIGHNKVNDQISQLMNYVGGFLNLTAVIALFVTATGVAYLFRNYFANRLVEVAILTSLGATQRASWCIVIAQLIAMGAASALVALAAVAIVTAVLPALLQQTALADIPIALSLYSFLFAVPVGALSSLLFCLPTLLRHRHVKPADIFSGRAQRYNPLRSDWLTLGSYLLLVLFFAALAVSQSDFRTGGVFVATFLAAVILFGLLSLLFIRLCDTFSSLPALKIALRNLCRQRLNSVSTFLAIALSAMLISVPSQIYRGIAEELRTPTGDALPDYLIFDIQEEQIAPLGRLLSTYQQSIQHLSPSVRARLLRINDEPFSDYLRRHNPDDAASSSGRNGFNLSYRSNLSKSEKIIAGEAITQPHDPESGDPIAVSLEERFAHRYGLAIGDRLLFNVLGLEFVSVVKNVRKVRWSSFQPNFFILFQTGVLEGAPKTFLGSINGLEAPQKAPLRRELSQSFPNVSMVDVNNLVGRILAMAQKVTIALALMAALAIFSGLAVTYAIARTETHHRRWDMNLLKVLGADSRLLTFHIVTEFGLLALIASSCGVAASAVLAYVLSRNLFADYWGIDWLTSIVSVALVTCTCVLLAVFASSSIIRQKPWKLLQT